MANLPVRDLACGGKDHFVTADGSDEVVLWSVAERRKIGQFSSTFDGASSDRLAVLASGEVATAGHDRGHVAVYDHDGTRLWVRRGPKGVESIAPMTLDARSAIAVARWGKRLAILDAITGETIAKGPAAGKVWQCNPSSLVCLGWDELFLYDLDRRDVVRKWALSRKTPVVVAHARDGFVFSESDGIHCVSNEGEAVWIWRAPKGTFAVGAGWDASISAWAIALDGHGRGPGPDGRALPDWMVLVDAAGKLVGDYMLTWSSKPKFFAGGDRFVCADGTVRTTSSGETVWAFSPGARA